MKIAATSVGLYALAAGLVSPVYAQTTDASAGTAESQMSEIIVTGTRRSERTVANSLAPIDSVDPKALAISPSSELNDQLAATVPSFNVQRMPGGDGAIFMRPASLRNLSPDQTLVLLNGHRRHRSAFVDVAFQGAQAVDLSQIPTAAVGRVEVLRDGASAQYGSDAIAGVINILLDDKPGTTLNALVGQYYKGDGFNLQLSGRSGFTLPGGGSLAIGGDYNHSTPTDRSFGIKNKVGQPSLDSYHFTYDLKLPVGGEMTLYSFGTYGHTKGWTEFSFHDPVPTDSIFKRSAFQNGPNAIFPAWNLTQVYPNGFAAQFGNYVNDAEVVVGIKGEIAKDLTIDISGDYGRNSIDYRVRNSINASLGPLSPTSFHSGDNIASQTAVNADATYLFDAGLTNPVSIGFGAEYRRERFESVAGDVASYQIGPLADLNSGALGFPGLQPESVVDGSRDSYAGYLDIEADLTDHLTVGTAGRYEHFSDFGSNFSYKFSGRYEISDAIAVRATYNTGFHAPAPGQQFFTKVATSPDLSQPAPYPVIKIGLVSPSDPLTAQFGGKALVPEKSRNISAGLVLTPMRGLTLTVDYYRVKIKNRIGLTPRLALPAGSAYAAIQFLINGFDTKTEGVDVVASWTHALGAGNLSLTGAYNYNTTRTTREDPIVIDRVSRPYIEDARPKHTATVTGVYDLDSFHLMGRVRYYGSWVDAIPFDQMAFGFPNQKLTPRAFVDVSVSYDVTPTTLVTVGAENLLNTYPDKNTSLLSLLGYSYPLLRPYEQDGGRWYVKLSQKF